MLVYGDHRTEADPNQRVTDIRNELDRLRKMESGLDRHAKLVGVTVETGQLLQGLADADFARHGRDRRTAATDELGAFLLEVAQALCRSWDSGFRELAALPVPPAGRDWPPRVELRLPEGFAFYAVYPEAYVDAARRLCLTAPPQVIGIRSIGTSLASVVAAAIGAPRPVTVRPFGDPSAREIALDASLERELLEGKKHYLVVDEGPGRSGSSFGSVASWLQDRGVPLDRISLLPSHCVEPGSDASPARRLWWQRVEREAGDFADRWRVELERWCAASIGHPDEPMNDLSGGAWRTLHFKSEEEWPAVVPAWERRKFLMRLGGEQMLARFAGLGRIGEDKLQRSRLLHSEGLVPEPLGLVHGFLVERWCDGTPLARGEKPLAEVASYIGRRARLLGTSKDSGASVEELITMARRNIGLEFGEDAARSLEKWMGDPEGLERRMLRIHTDNNLSSHEWLRTKSGKLIKTDALDHSQAHDLIGCQDLAWDVAGAITEFEAERSAVGEFVAAVEEWAGRSIDSEVLQFSRIAYLAFRLGQARLGETMVERVSERRRINSRGKRYALELQHLLESSIVATRHESSVD